MGLDSGQTRPSGIEEEDLIDRNLAQKYNFNRQTWIDTCRGIGILLVVLGHCNPPFCNLIYAFHMPLFFILSGYLYKERKPVADYGKRMLRRYITPYFILCFINLLIALIWDRGENFGRYILGILYSRGTTTWMPNCSPLWFLTGITVALFLYNLIMYIGNRWLQGLSIVACVVVSYTLYLLEVPKLPWNFDTALMAITFIALGHWLYKRHIHFSSPVYLFYGCIGIVAAYLNPTGVDFDSNEYGNLLWMFMAGAGISIFLIYMVRRCNPLSRVLNFYGRHTIFIMGFDYFSGRIVGKVVGCWTFQFVGKVAVLTAGVWLWYYILVYRHIDI